MNPPSLAKYFAYSALLGLLLSSVSAVITSADAISIAPSILDKAAVLEDTLDEYKMAQIQIAAIKLKSLLPDYVPLNGASKNGNLRLSAKQPAKSAKNKDDSNESADSEDSDDAAADDENEDSADSDNSDEDELEEIPSSTILLTNSLNSLLKSLDPEHAAVVKTFNSDLNEFIAEKEKEAAQKFQESLEAIREIQTVLQTDHATNFNLTVELLARIVSKLDDLQEEYEDIQALQKRLKSSNEKKRNKAKKELQESQIKIQKIVQKLSEMISE